MVTWLAKCRASPGVPQLLLQSWDWAGSRSWPGLPHLPGPPSSSALILSRHLSQGAPVMPRWAAKTYINFQAGGNPSWGGKHLPSHFPSPLSVLPRLPGGGQGSLVSSRSSPTPPGPSRRHSCNNLPSSHQFPLRREPILAPGMVPPP